MQTISDVTLLEKIVSNTTYLTTQLHVVQYVKGLHSHSITFICRGTESDKCHRYPNCACEYWEANHIHPKVKNKECSLAAWFADNGLAAHYAGTDGISRYTNGEMYLLPPTTRTGFIHAWIEREGLEWQWIEALDRQSDSEVR